MLSLTGVFFVLSLFVGSSSSAATATDEEIAVSLASLLRASRAVISKNQKHINDASIGDKGLSADVVIKTARENYKAATNSSLDDIEASNG